MDVYSGKLKVGHCKCAIQIGHKYFSVVVK